MSAAETPPAGHETAASCGWLGVADPAVGVNAPEGHDAGPERVVGLKGDLCGIAMTRPARQPSAARQASAVRRVRIVLRSR
jgi:hypothetical protein